MAKADIYSSKAKRELWVIYDPLDGAHIFGSKKKAETTLTKWQKAGDSDPFDSVWDMTGPFRYVLSDA